MKRSEAIEELARVFYQISQDPEGPSFPPFENYESEWLEKGAIILSVVEKMGMLPPTRFYGGEPPLNFEMPVKTNTWEPENE
jgi:hypothetical protein